MLLVEPTGKMRAQKKKAKPPELKVVFDTNAIYTDAAAFLVKREVGDIIRANSSHPDLQIRWFLPEVVKLEREFQMRENGFELLPSIQKIEKVLRHNLNITEKTIIERVPLLVNEQLQDLGIEIASFNADAINWSRVVSDATSRNPPFEKGEKEKGFRDAVILESFLQLVESSPKTPSSCLIALVVRDGPLTTAAKNRTASAKNVRFVEDVSALKGLINTLVAQVDEEFVETIKKGAGTYFFNPEDKTGLIYREKVTEQIKNKFGKELNAIPTGYVGKDFSSIFVGDTRFSKKIQRRVYWVTRLHYAYKPYRWDATATYESLMSSFAPLASPQSDVSQGPAGLWGLATQHSAPGGSAGGPGPITPKLGDLLTKPSAPRQKIFGDDIKILVDVTWSVVVSTARHKFSAAKVESIDHVPAT